jgi:hypothetical protein
METSPHLPEREERHVSLVLYKTDMSSDRLGVKNCLGCVHEGNKDQTFSICNNGK